MREIKLIIFTGITTGIMKNLMFLLIIILLLTFFESCGNQFEESGEGKIEIINSYSFNIIYSIKRNDNSTNTRYGEQTDNEDWDSKHLNILLKGRSSDKYSEQFMAYGNNQGIPSKCSYIIFYNRQDATDDVRERDVDFSLGSDKKIHLRF